MEGVKVSGRAVPANLDTKGICFLCLRDKDFVNDCISNKSLLSNTDLFSLNGMSRFLNLNIETILLKKMDLRVSLCGECSLITKRFKALYQSLELTKMRLIECVGKIHDLMTESQNDCDRMEEAVSRMAENDDGDSHKIGSIFKVSQRAVMDYLRKEMIIKCLTKMKTALPRVRVRKTKMESKPKPLETIIVKVEPELQLEMETVSPILPTSTTHTKEPSPAPEMFTAATMNSTVGPETKLNQASRTPRKSKILLRRVDENVVAAPAVAVTPLERERKKPLIQQCPHCNGFLTSKKLLRYHKFRHHVEQDFLDFKDSSVTPDQFVKTVHHLLFQDLDEMMKSCVVKTCTCNYCGLKFCYTKNTKMDPFKIHMIKHHHSSLVEKLIELQKDPDLNEKLELAVSASGGKTCSCGTYVSSVQRMVVHQNCYCPVKNRYKSTSKTYSCWHPNCDAVFTKNDRLLNHMLKHNAKAQEELGISKTSQTASNQQASSSSEIPHAFSTEAVLSSDNPERNVEIPVEEKGTSWCCTYCNVVVSKRARLRDHIMRFHRDHYFLEFRYDSVSLNQFKKLVNNLLFKDIEEDGELINAGRSYLSCSYCDKQFVKTVSQGTIPLVLHMMNSHRQCLGSKLAELQSDPNLNEKLAVAVSASGGMTCSCGSYFPNKTQLGIHKNKYCHEGPVYRKVCSQIRCFKCGKTFHPKGISGHLKKCNASFTSLKGKIKRIKLEQPALSNKANCKECGELVCIWNAANHRQTCPGMALKEASSSSHQSDSYPEGGLTEPDSNTNMDTDSALLRQLLTETEEATSSYEHENSDYCISQSSEMQNLLRDPLED